jgi:hypothetical protein
MKNGLVEILTLLLNYRNDLSVKGTKIKIPLKYLTVDGLGWGIDMVLTRVRSEFRCMGLYLITI